MWWDEGVGVGVGERGWGRGAEFQSAHVNCKVCANVGVSRFSKLS